MWLATAEVNTLPPERPFSFFCFFSFFSFPCEAGRLSHAPADPIFSAVDRAQEKRPIQNVSTAQGRLPFSPSSPSFPSWPSSPAHPRPASACRRQTVDRQTGDLCPRGHQVRQAYL
jgi:hypothetical protein